MLACPRLGSGALSICSTQEEHLLLPLQVFSFKVCVRFKFTISIKINELCAAAHMQLRFVELCLNVGCGHRLRDSLPFG